MPSRNSVEVLMSVFVGLIHDLLEVCFPHNVSVAVQDFKVTIERSVQYREILVNPCERFVSKGNIERCVAGFGSSCSVYRRLIGRFDSKMFLSGLENADSSVVVCLRPCQVRFGGVLPRKCDSTCSIWYSPIKPREGGLSETDSKRREGITGIILQLLRR